MGFKPSQGRVSRHGAMPLSFSQDCIGPLARSVADAHLVYRIIAGPDGHDGTMVPGPDPNAALPEAVALRFGFAASGFCEHVAAPVALALAQCRDELEKARCACVAVPVPDLAGHGELANVIAMAEGAAFHFDWLRTRPEDYGPQVRARLMQGLAIPAPVYLRALQYRPVLLAQFLDSVFSRCDVLVLPTMPFPAPRATDMDVGDGQAMNQMVADMARFTRPLSFLGLPAVSLPVVWVDGLPVSVQIVARPLHDHVAVAAASLLETLFA